VALRILLVNSERGVGGGLSSSVELAEGLAARGALITVVCHPDSSLRKRLDAGGRVQVAPVAIRAELNAWRAVQIAHVLERARHDVIIADRRKDVKLSLGATLLRPGPALVHRHGAPSVLRDSAMYHTIWTRLDGMIVNSHRMKRLLLEATPWLAAIPIDVIHNGKDMARFRPRPDLRDAMRDALGIGRDRFVIAFHGVLQERKRLDVPPRTSPSTCHRQRDSRIP
jgi:glycosyltransferase involved in cell wall biosynthesis